MILVCGEALIDLFVGDGAGGASLPVQAAAGGSPFNLAVGLARLGAPVGYLGGLSRDSFGAFLTARLAAEGVETGQAKRSTRPTPLAVVSPDPAGHPEYTFHAQDCADRDLTPADLPPTLGPEVEAVAMGSYTLAVEPVGSAFLALAQREAANRVVSIDPNLRPAVIGSLDRWRERFDGFLRASSIVKLSLEDLQAAYGTATAPEELARRWLDMGVGLVVLTMGERGAVAWSARGSAVQPGRQVAVADTVGAGDTFHAALLARLRQRGLLRREAVAALDTETLGDVLHFGTVAAGITCSRRGADLPRAAEVEAALSRTVG
jgi:fructokinase